MHLYLMSFLALVVTAGDVSDLSPVMSAMGTIIQLLGMVWSAMTANPLLVVFLASSLLVVGIRIFRKVKAAAKG